MNEKLNKSERDSKSDLKPFVMLPLNTFENKDCMDVLRSCPPNYFDLAIVDPPYGISVNMNAGKKKGEKDRYKNKDWDTNIPEQEYFHEIKRVSKNQVVWGCNYFNGMLWAAGRLSWFKNNGAGNDFSDCELAMHTFNNRVTNISVQWSGFIKPASERGTDRIHPTQKPIDLYKWILKEYAKVGDKILDTHVGSGSSIVACIELGYEYYGCEIDKDYYEAASKRIGRAYRKPELFDKVT